MTARREPGRKHRAREEFLLARSAGRLARPSGEAGCAQREKEDAPGTALQGGGQRRLWAGPGKPGLLIRGSQA